MNKQEIKNKPSTNLTTDKSSQFERVVVPQPRQDRIILDLCGGTGSWSKPYADNGYNVKVITLPEIDVYTYYDYWNFISNVYGIFAAPTCTYFSMARTTKKATLAEHKEGLALVNRCTEIITDCTMHGNLKFWAMENPMGKLRKFLGKPVLTFNPNEFGDSYTKKTDVWGYFNIPKRFERILTDEEKAKCKINNRDLPKLPTNYTLPKTMKCQAARRSMTSVMFAEAFYKANK